MLKKLNIPQKDLRHYVGHNPDADTACAIIDVIFNEINGCIRYDRSKVKLNALAKGVISSMLGDKTRNNIKNYVKNMDDSDLTNLLNGIQKEIGNRKR